MNIGIVATRIAGLDGVSLEIEKIATVLRRMGHDVFFCAGELGEWAQPGVEDPALHFQHPEAIAIHDEAFSGPEESRALYQRIARAAAQHTATLYRFAEQFRLDALITQNAQAIPMQVALGVALRDFLDETHIPAIGHYHDFYWERERFLVNRIPDVLRTAFPAEGSSIRHVVISTAMQRELYMRRGLHATYLPNVFDFAHPPAPPDAHAQTVREEFGIGLDERLLLQPTRVIRRKNIERAVELTRLLAARDPAHRYVLVITGDARDETGTYFGWLQRQIAEAGIRALFVGDRIAEERGVIGGRRFYSLWDFYPHADFVTYLSSYEGFGNALIETLYFRKPLVVNAYTAYRSDIRPAGVQAVEIREEVTPEAVEQVVALLESPDEVARLVEHNYQVGRAHFSYEVLEATLRALLP